MDRGRQGSRPGAPPSPASILLDRTRVTNAVHDADLERQFCRKSTKRQYGRRPRAAAWPAGHTRTQVGACGETRTVRDDSVFYLKIYPERIPAPPQGEALNSL